MLAAVFMSEKLRRQGMCAYVRMWLRSIGGILGMNSLTQYRSRSRKT